MSKYVLCECDEASEIDHSQESVSYGELAELSHAEQIHRYGWCGCEDSDPVYDDCPTKITRIDGTITDSRGVVTRFTISDEGWLQWAGTDTELGKRVELLERLAETVYEVVN